MSTTALVVIYASILFLHSSYGNNKLMGTHWKMNTELTRSFPCDEPQPRAVPIHELITEDDDDNVQEIFGRNSLYHVVPESVVLHRCANAGCCAGRQKTCSILKEESITLTFRYYISKTSNFIHLPVSNHTKCTCAENKSNNIK